MQKIAHTLNGKGGAGRMDYESETFVTHTLKAEFDASEDGTGRGTPIIAFSCKDSGADCGEQAPTLRSMNNRDGNANAGGQVAVAFKFHQGAGARSLGESETTSPTLNTDWHVPAISQHMAVRRLTPIECERLQGFPDNWTLIEYHGKSAKDGPRYRAIGNSMAVPVMQWLGKRIQEVENL